MAGFFSVTVAVGGGIPDLRPPHGPLPPGPWEQAGQMWEPAGLLLVIVGMAFLVWRVSRRSRRTVLSAADIARSRLRNLVDDPDTADLAGQVSGEIRRYVTAATGHAGEELTAEELVKALADAPRLDAESVQQVADLLQECNRNRFAPASPKAPALAARALELVERFEQQRQPLPESP